MNTQLQWDILLESTPIYPKKRDVSFLYHFSDEAVILSTRFDNDVLYMFWNIGGSPEIITLKYQGFMRSEICHHANHLYEEELMEALL